MSQASAALEFIANSGDLALNLIAIKNYAFLRCETPHKLPLIEFHSAMRVSYCLVSEVNMWNSSSTNKQECFSALCRATLFCFINQLILSIDNCF